MTVDEPDPDRVWVLDAPAGSKERRERVLALIRQADERGEPLNMLARRLHAIRHPKHGIGFLPL